MSDPIHVNPDTFAGMSLQPLVDELLASPQVEREGKTARTLVKDPSLTVVLTVLRAGAQLLEHAAPGSVVVVPIRGDVKFEHEQQASTTAVEGAQITVMGPGLRHRVVAQSDSAFLLIIGARA